MLCPNCQNEIKDESAICGNCNFDIELYNKTYEKIYLRKLNELNQAEENRANENKYIVKTQSVDSNVNDKVHKPRCPYCNSEDITRISAIDKAVNIAMFGLLGNKRKYQWHCNNCKTNW